MEGKIISWQTYCKSNPKKYCVEDFIGSKTVVVPTLKTNGFRVIDWTEYDKREIKPKEVAIEVLKDIDFEEAVYCPMVARDGNCYWVTVGYKLKTT